MRNIATIQAAASILDPGPYQPLVDFKSSLLEFHKSERGDNENLGRMLVLALIMIPIIIVLTAFGKQIVEQSKTVWEQVVGASG